MRRGLGRWAIAARNKPRTGFEVVKTIVLFCACATRKPAKKGFFFSCHEVKGENNRLTIELISYIVFARSDIKTSFYIARSLNNKHLTIIAGRLLDALHQKKRSDNAEPEDKENPEYRATAFA